MRNKILIVIIMMFGVIFCLNSILATSAEEANIADYVGLFATIEATGGSTGDYQNAPKGLIDMLMSKYSYRVNYREADVANGEIGTYSWNGKSYVYVGGETAYITENEWNAIINARPDSGGKKKLKFVKMEQSKLDKLVESGEYFELTDNALNGTGNKAKLYKSTMEIRFNDGSILTVPRYILTELTASQGEIVRITANISFVEDTVTDYQENSGDFWGSASAWFGSVQGSYTLPEQVNKIIGTFTDMINVVGTTVIVIATIVLGIKYMIGTVDSKTSAKEGLITLLVACVFFFGWTAISELLYGGDNLNFIFTSSTDVSYKVMVGRLFNTFTYIAQFIVVGAIIYVGIKYIFAGASGRAELKGKSVYFIIGIILVFATTNVLSFISKIINEAI